MPWKKIGIGAAILFFAYFVVTAPTQAAYTVRTAAIGLANAANAVAASLSTFLTRLF